VAGGWRRTHNEELHNLYASPSNIRLIQSKRKRWVSNVIRMGEMRNAYKIFVQKIGRKETTWRKQAKNVMTLLECEGKGNVVPVLS
jgi:hypothetical protein